MVPMTIEVRHDFQRLAATLDDFALRQMPYAAARALTDTAHVVQRGITAALPAIFDRPNPFTQMAIGIVPARKESLAAEIFVKDIQAAYLRLEETGGERVPEPGKPVAIPIPGAIALDAYGNIPRGALARLKGRKNVFVGTVKGVTGFWQRGPFRSLRLLVALRPRAAYRPRFGWHGMVEQLVGSAFAPALDKRLTEALETARP